MLLSRGDVQIFYRVQGSGPPVVLLHPFPANHNFWLPAAEALSARYRLVLPDLRGHGDSGVGEPPATMQKHAADIAALCDELALVRAVFCGVSIGGYILMEFWRRYAPRVSALALCNTRAPADTPEGRAGRLKSADEVERKGTAAFIEAMLPKLLGATTRAHRPDLVEQARSMMARMSAAGIAAVQRGMAERPDSFPTLKTVTVPTLILAGEEDTLTPVEDAERMRQAVPQSRLEVLPRAGHFALFEQPHPAGKLLRGFLDAVVP